MTQFFLVFIVDVQNILEINFFLYFYHLLVEISRVTSLYVIWHVQNNFHIFRVKIILIMHLDKNETFYIDTFISIRTLYTETIF